MSDQPAVFITGGTGFVGRHVVDALNANNYEIRALVRTAPNPPLPQGVKIITGDLTKPATYSDALAGVSAVVHSALTDQVSNDVQASVQLHRLSAAAGVRQFVHLSSIAVYGQPAEGTIVEDTDAVPNEPYAQAKWAIEEALRSAPPLPELVILRLSCVYGPGKSWWSNTLLNMMERGKLIVVNGGVGTANLIHVQDAAALVLKVLERRNAACEIFNVTDGQPVSWRRYFDELEKILGRKATVSMTAEEARRYSRQWARPSLVRRAFRKLTGGAIIYLVDDKGIDAYVSRAVYSSQKAFRVLGFTPQFDLERGTESVRKYRNSLNSPR